MLSFLSIYTGSLTTELFATEKPAIVHSNFIPAAAPWQTRQNNTMLDFGPLVPLCENMTSSAEVEVRNVLHCQQRRTKPWPATGNAYRKFHEIWTRGFPDMQVDRYTNWQTHTDFEYFVHLSRPRTPVPDRLLPPMLRSHVLAASQIRQPTTSGRTALLA